MLSSRLNAFVIPTSQTSATRPASRSFEISPEIVSPFASTIAGGGDLRRELRDRPEGRGRRAGPATKRSAQPPRIASELAGSPATAPTASASRRRRRGRRRCRSRRTAASSARASGPRAARATRRAASGERRSSQIAAAAAGNAAIAASAFTEQKRNEGLLAPCEAASRLGRAHDDGLRRSRPLPRAVREPLPPRPPGEVQGLGARRSSGRSRTRSLLMGVYLLVFSVLWKTHGRDRALPALPARRPRAWIFFATSLQAGVALDARQRGPDPEDALPAPARRRSRSSRRSSSRFGVMLAVLLVLNFALHPARRATRCGSRSRSRRSSSASSAGSRSRRVAERALPRRRAPLAALLLPWFFLTPSSIRSSRSADRDGATGLVDLDPLGESVTPPIEALRDPLFYGASAGARRRDLPRRRRGRRARARRVRVQRASTTGSQSSSDPRRVVDPRLVAFGQPAPAGPRPRVFGSSGGSSDGQTSGCAKRGIAAAAAAPTARAPPAVGARSRSTPPTAA